MVRALSEAGREVEHIRGVVDLAVDGDPDARRLLREAGRQLGEVLAAAVNLLNPEAIVVGGDMAASLPQWREPQAILELCTIGAAARDGVGRDEVLERLDRELPGASARIDFFDMPRIDISSTLIRRRVAAGEPVRYLVPDAVAATIEREGLYR